MFVKYMINGHWTLEQSFNDKEGLFCPAPQAGCGWREQSELHTSFGGAAPDLRLPPKRGAAVWVSPSEGKQRYPPSDLRRDAGLRSSRRDAWPPPPPHRLVHLDATRLRCSPPAGMCVSFHQTDSLASSLFIHNCKQTEAAVGVAPQLPSWLKTRLSHRL